MSCGPPHPELYPDVEVPLLTTLSSWERLLRPLTSAPTMGLSDVAAFGHEWAGMQDAFSRRAWATWEDYVLGQRAFFARGFDSSTTF